jgi:hypothetical protein
MTNLQRKLTTALATGAVLANAFVPAAFANTSLVITGNGSDSESTADEPTPLPLTTMSKLMLTQVVTAQVTTQVET